MSLLITNPHYKPTFATSKQLEELTRESASQHLLFYMKKADVLLNIEQASLFEDQKKATDLKAEAGFAMRCYGADKERFYRKGLTIRYWRASGATTEWEKILRLECPPYYLQCIQHPAEEDRVLASRLIDLHGLAHALNSEESFRSLVEATEKVNRDGKTSFVTIPFSEMHSRMLVIGQRRDFEHGGMKVANYQAMPEHILYQ